MSLTVSLSFGERFLNWYATHTKLYIRGQRGKDWAGQRELDRELAKALNAWFAPIEVAIRADERTKCAGKAAAAGGSDGG